MSIPAEDIHFVSYHVEITMSVAMEKYYSWEVKAFGRASDNTRNLRHYWLIRLLERQLKEFDRG